MSPAPTSPLPAGRARSWTLAALLLLAAAVPGARAQHETPPAGATPRGLIVHEPGVAPGYVLVAPLRGRTTYLIDNAGEIVVEWPSAYGPGAVYLMDDGSILRMGRLEDPPRFHGGGIAGLFERIRPDGTVTWRYELASDERVSHHDVEVLPNGNVLFIAWEHVEPLEALRHGRDPEATSREEGLWPDVVYEVRPTPPEGGEIVWEWHVWDHLVQDLVARAEDHGVVADHPGRVDVNADHRDAPPLTDEERERLLAIEEQMRALGYAGGNVDAAGADDGGDDARDRRPDWLHTNAVDYHAGHDLIVLSTPRLCELWVIDHSTTTAEAAGERGGRWGRGGELLWRWGNPRNYGHGGEADQQLFYQHDPQWLDGSNAGALDPGAAVADGLRLTLFNNGGGRPGGDHSSVDELVLPFDPERGFTRAEGAPFGPAEPAWTYRDPDFFSAFISGAQRLPNGNTLVCEGTKGRVFEITREGTVVWDWRNPFGGDAPPPKGVDGVPSTALFRATRYAPDHPGVVALLGH